MKVTTPATGKVTRIEAKAVDCLKDSTDEREMNEASRRIEPPMESKMTALTVRREKSWRNFPLKRAAKAKFKSTMEKA